MGILRVIFFCGLTNCLIQMTNTQQPTAEIDGSRIIGQTVKFSSREAHQYLGIPYAEPPVGPLRFQKPKPFQSYSSEYEAFDNPPACPQYTTLPVPYYVGIKQKSEDCLYLNIWTPIDASSKNKKAVLYFMFGGGHRFGAINDPIYNGTRMAILGDIIVVTVNYRVGYFGFLTSNSPEAPGNVGVWDVLEGLKWVNKNIEAFGGDSTRITIAGETAGAVNVGLFSISPLAKGLYARQIMQTDSPINRRSDNSTKNLAFSQQLAVYVGCANDSYTIEAHPKEVVECLQGIDADKISEADYDLDPTPGYHLVPQFGDELLENNPRVSILGGEFACTDTLIGSINEVGSYQMTTLEYRDYFGFFGQKNPHVNRSLGEDIIRKSVSEFPNPDDIVNHFLPESLPDDTDYRIRNQTCTALGDAGFLCPVIYYAEKCAEQNKNVYAYYFTHRPSNSPWAPWMGATLFDDVPFVFGTPIHNSEFNHLESRLSEKIVLLFTSFVKNGKPDDSWPLYSKEKRIYRLLGTNYTTDGLAVGGPHTQNCLFLKPYFGF